MRWPAPRRLRAKRNERQEWQQSQRPRIPSASMSVETHIDFSTGLLAKQADGAVVVRSGETMVLATVVGRTEPVGRGLLPAHGGHRGEDVRRGQDPGRLLQARGAGDREGHAQRAHGGPADPAAVPKGFRNEVQVIGTILSVDRVLSHDILAINGASAALVLSPLPFFGPIGAVRVGRIEGELVVNPTMPDMVDSSLDLIVCRHRRRHHDGRGRGAAGLRGVLLDALELAHENIRKLCAAQLELQALAGKPKWYDPAVEEELAQRHGARFDAAIAEHGIAGVAIAENEILADELPPVAADAGEEVMVRRTQVRTGLRFIADAGARPRSRRRCRSSSATRSAACRTPSRTPRSSSRPSARRSSSASSPTCSCRSRPARAASWTPQTASAVKGSIDSIYKQIVRRRSRSRSAAPTAARRTRSGRSLRGRPAAAHARLGLFQRGETQVARRRHPRHRSATSSARRPVARETKRFMLHYNFPPYSVGEVGRMRGPAAARLATAPSPSARSSRSCPSPRSSPTPSASSPRSWSQRQHLDGDGLRRHAGADGRRRADQGAGGRHRHGPDQGEAATTTSSLPTSRAPRTTSATWTSRSPAPARHHRPPGGLQDPRPHPARSCGTRWPAPARPASHPRQACAEAIAEPRTSSPATRRGCYQIQIPREKIGASSAPAARRSADSSTRRSAVDVEDDGSVRIVLLERTRRCRQAIAIIEEPDPGRPDRRHVPRPRRQDGRLRRLRRAAQGHRRPAARLAHRAGVRIDSADQVLRATTWSRSR